MKVIQWIKSEAETAAATQKRMQDHETVSNQFFVFPFLNVLRQCKELKWDGGDGCDKRREKGKTERQIRPHK